MVCFVITLNEGLFVKIASLFAHYKNINYFCTVITK